MSVRRLSHYLRTLLIIIAYSVAVNRAQCSAVKFDHDVACNENTTHACVCQVVDKSLLDGYLPICDIFVVPNHPLPVIALEFEGVNLAGHTFSGDPYEALFKKKVADIIGTHCAAHAEECPGTGVPINPARVILLDLDCVEGTDHSRLLFVVTHGQVSVELATQYVMDPGLVVRIIATRERQLRHAVGSMRIIELKTSTKLVKAWLPGQDITKAPVTPAEQRNNRTLLIIMAGIGFSLCVCYVIAIYKVCVDYHQRKAAAKAAEALNNGQTVTAYGAIGGDPAKKDSTTTKVAAPALTAATSGAPPSEKTFIIANRRSSSQHSSKHSKSSSTSSRHKQHTEPESHITNQFASTSSSQQHNRRKTSNSSSSSNSSNSHRSSRHSSCRSKPPNTTVEAVVEANEVDADEANESDSLVITPTQSSVQPQQSSYPLCEDTGYYQADHGSAPQSLDYDQTQQAAWQDPTNQCPAADANQQYQYDHTADGGDGQEYEWTQEQLDQYYADYYATQAAQQGEYYDPTIVDGYYQTQQPTADTDYNYQYYNTANYELQDDRQQNEQPVVPAPVLQSDYVNQQATTSEPVLPVLPELPPLPPLPPPPEQTATPKAPPPPPPRPRPPPPSTSNRVHPMPARASSVQSPPGTERSSDESESVSKPKRGTYKPNVIGRAASKDESSSYNPAAVTAEIKARNRSATLADINEAVKAQDDESDVSSGSSTTSLEASPEVVSLSQQATRVVPYRCMSPTAMLNPNPSMDKPDVGVINNKNHAPDSIPMAIMNAFGLATTQSSAEMPSSHCQPPSAPALSPPKPVEATVDNPFGDDVWVPRDDFVTDTPPPENTLKHPNHGGVTLPAQFGRSTEHLIMTGDVQPEHQEDIQQFKMYNAQDSIEAAVKEPTPPVCDDESSSDAASSSGEPESDEIGTQRYDKLELASADYKRLAESNVSMNLPAAVNSDGAASPTSDRPPANGGAGRLGMANNSNMFDRQTAI